MSRKSILSLVLAVLLIAALGASFAALRYYTDLPNRLSQHETILLGQSKFAPGSQAEVRILVRDSRGGAPLPGARVRLALRPQNGGSEVQLFDSATAADGSLVASFQVPKDAQPEQTLVVETTSSLGSDRFERPVQVARDYRVLLSSDKPVYQPGQAIHLRALALSAYDSAPAANQPLELTIADGKGNKVFRQQLTTSAYGAAWTDFQLAGEVNTGDYKISAALGSTSSEKTVTVEPYVLPKFKVELKTERSYYTPGQHVSGTLQADYFFGKPVANAKVTLQGYTFDVQKNEVLRQELTTGEGGQASFEFDLPTYLAGSDLESGMGRFYLQAAVTDATQHGETASLSLPVSASGLVIQAVPEAGVFQARVDNILYLMTSYPDGTPADAQATLTFYENNRAVAVRTGEFGIAMVHVTPDSPYQQFRVSAQDARGASAQKEFNFQGDWSEETVLLRPDKPVYKVGETMNLALLSTSQQGTAYLDIVRGGQTVSTRSVPIENGQGRLAVDLTPELYGTLELHAYKILSSGAIVRDTRLVVVDPATDLTVQVASPQGSYKPGDTAPLDFTVSAGDGRGVQSALGIAVVDEAVFALAESDPGFARLYFLLESQILTPRYDLHGLSLPDLVKGLPQETLGLRAALSQAAMASLAEASRGQTAFTLQANSHQETLNRAIQIQNKFFTAFTDAAFSALLAAALGLGAVVGLDLLRRKILGRSLLSALGLVSFLLLLILLAPLPGGDGSVAPLYKIEQFFGWLSQEGASVLALLGLAAGAGYLALIGAAVARRDAWLGWTAGLLAAFGAVLGLFVLAVTRYQTMPPAYALIFLIVAILLAPLALWARLAGFLWEKRPLAALAALPLAFFLLAGLLPAASLGATRSANLGGPVMVDDMAMQRAAGPALPQMAVPAAAPAATQVPAVAEAPSGNGGQAAAQPPRLRQYFPETMDWIPDALTGPDGKLRLDLPVADSITTWRVTALASSQDGRLGSVSAPLRAFQDFFIDLDLPVSLTVGDEVSVPVGVYNYLSEPQTVRLELAQSGWFELLGQPVQELQIGANDVRVAYFRVRAAAFGQQALQVTAAGSRLSDAIKKEVRVYPDGKPIRASASDRLAPGVTARQTLTIPAEAVPGTQSLTVKVYPGVLSQVVEGLDSILRMPSGCFEQTSSATYPNVLVLDYLRGSKQTAPQSEMKAEEYINLGYQRLLTFEVQSSGGFSLFGQAPADRMLTAYGLQEFSDMSRVHAVDPALLRRAADWLASQQSADGSWENDRGLVHESTWSSLGNDRLPVTAYITWSLVAAGFGKESAAQRGLAYVRQNAAQAKDAYVAALVANALVAGDLAKEQALSAAARDALERLVGMAKQDGQNVYWQSGIATFVGGEGQTASIETTSLAAYALLRGDLHPETANAALGYLVSQKDSFGTWHSTQATVLALKALIQSVRAGSENANAEVSVTLNGGQAKKLQITPANFDVVQQVSFDDVPLGKPAVVEIQASGKGNLMYQATAGYYLPWDQLSAAPQGGENKEDVTIQVSYDRAALAVNDTVGVDVKVSFNQDGARAQQALIDLGLPPGFSLVTEDLDALVARDKALPEGGGQTRVQRYELTGRQILVYLTDLQAGRPLEFSFHLRARYPLRVQTPASSIYDYYNPAVNGDARPQMLEVKSQSVGAKRNKPSLPTIPVSFALLQPH